MSDAGEGSASTERVEMLKRPRLLSYQGCSQSHSAERDVGLPMAGASSSSLEQLDRREQAADDLRSWQESQIAQCVGDNILNTVLEQYVNFYEQRNNRNGGTEQQHEQQQQPPQPNDDEVLEDEAIRMAINERGLQRAGTSSGTTATVAALAEVAGGEQPGPSWAGLGRTLQDNFILDTAVAAAIQEKGLVAGTSADAEPTDSDDSSMLQEDDTR
ncbi:uncharacterized protein LOC126581741 [Anopheles aquasalis]|uniref:uncharacterized protein LOC126581741 n=1 Tax=Anopheles aquasalis TaxID=42839 RepID=UPI00215A5165|nr:uncharacterized protein LOC126581741 [Anopheles aquasalis]